MQRLFGVGLHTRFTCAESGEAEEEDASAFELKCNITSEVNQLSEGLRLGLVSDREKNSAALGRLALFQVPQPWYSDSSRQRRAGPPGAVAGASPELLVHYYNTHGICLLPQGLLGHALVC